MYTVSIVIRQDSVIIEEDVAGVFDNWADADIYADWLFENDPADMPLPPMPEEFN